MDPSRPFLAVMDVLNKTHAGVCRFESSIVLITIDKGGALLAARVDRVEDRGREGGMIIFSVLLIQENGYFKQGSMNS